MGDKTANCRKGISALTTPENKVVLRAESRFYRTAPVDYLDQDWFVNAAIEVETALDPMVLLGVMQKVQKRVGQGDKAIRFGPRLLDLDIIFFDDLVIESDPLIIPHPRMHKRRFVLQPLCDINPSLVHPELKRDVKSLLDSLGDDPSQVVPCSL